MGSASARASAQTAIAERKEQLKMMGKLRKQADKLKKVSLIQYFDKMVSRVGLVFDVDTKQILSLINIKCLFLPFNSRHDAVTQFQSS